MLVLSRRTNEEIVVGNNIRITVVEVIGGRVKLGISAPEEIPIHRSEVRDRLQSAGRVKRNNTTCSEAAG
jgi:carbon storage regulator